MPLSPLHPPTVQIPPPYCNFPEFIADWSDWLQMRKEQRHPISPMICKRALKFFCDLGMDAGRAAIAHCIAGGYQGCFADPTYRGVAKTSAIGNRSSVIATPQESHALADYKRQASLLPARERGDLLAKARDTLPAHMAQELANYIWVLGRSPS